MAGVSDRHLILYDAECGFCRRSLGWILRWDRRGELEPVALQDPRAAELLADLEPEERMDSWHLVSPAGERWSAGAAAAPLLRLLPGGDSAGVAPGGRTAHDRARLPLRRRTQGRLRAPLPRRPGG